VTTPTPTPPTSVSCLAITFRDAITDDPILDMSQLRLHKLIKFNVSYVGAGQVTNVALRVTRNGMVVDERLQSDSDWGESIDVSQPGSYTFAGFLQTRDGQWH